MLSVVAISTDDPQAVKLALTTAEYTREALAAEEKP